MCVREREIANESNTYWYILYMAARMTSYVYCLNAKADDPCPVYSWLLNIKGASTFPANGVKTWNKVKWLETAERRHRRHRSWSNVWLACGGQCIWLCVCVWVMTAYAAVRFGSGWGLSGCLIIYPAEWLLCRVQCAEREARLATTASWLICAHHLTCHATNTHTHTYTEMYA